MPLFKPRLGLLVGPQAVHVHNLREPADPRVFASLREALAPHAGTRARLEIVLTDALCRYLVMARPQGVRNRAELTAAMHSRFHAMFADAGEWELQHAAAPSDGEDLVVGADRAMLARIAVEAAQAGARIGSIRPHWTAWGRHFRRHTRRGDHWIVAAGSDGWASVGYLSAGRCRLARSLRMPAGSHSLDELLARARAFVGDADAQAPVWVGGEAIDIGATAAAHHANGAALWMVSKAAA